MAKYGKHHLVQETTKKKHRKWSSKIVNVYLIYHTHKIKKKKKTHKDVVSVDVCIPWLSRKWKVGETVKRCLNAHTDNFQSSCSFFARMLWQSCWAIYVCAAHVQQVALALLTSIWILVIFLWLRVVCMFSIMGKGQAHHKSILVSFRSKFWRWIRLRTQAARIQIYMPRVFAWNVSGCMQKLTRGFRVQLLTRTLTFQAPTTRHSIHSTKRCTELAGLGGMVEYWQVH